MVKLILSSAVACLSRTSDTYTLTMHSIDPVSSGLFVLTIYIQYGKFIGLLSFACTHANAFLTVVDIFIVED